MNLKYNLIISGENREGYNAKGEYQVNLPDGRVATVTYKVDGPSGGFVADVKYDGVSVYPDAPPPAPYHPAPSYAPAPPAPAAPKAAPAAPEPAAAEEPAAPVYEPAPAPVYKPAPAPVYKPAPGKFIYYLAHCGMRNKSSMFLSSVFKNLIFLCSF